MHSSDPSDHETHLKAGDLVAGRFRIVEVIGTGGFSVVYRAHQEGMNRFVALKVLKPQASTDEKIVERFRREALFASQLSHPNTITLFDYGQTGEGLYYIAMEHLVGQDLSAELVHCKPMDLKRVWWILVQICRSLSEAHRVGLIHRDLKPENIFLQERNGKDHVQVLDFGVSKALSHFGFSKVQGNFGRTDAASLGPLTLEGTVFGTPLYMAPEQVMAEDLTAAVDVYALGQLAYEMISGRAAYDRDLSPMEVMLLQINAPPLTLPEPWDQTPFSPLIEACTQKKPSERICNAAKLLDRLMSEDFLPYMPSTEIPPNLRIAGAHLNQLAALQSAEDELAQTGEIYRWELTVLNETLREVQESSQIRQIVIRGRPGTGRSNLLRAFLKRHKNKPGIRILHRKSREDGRGHLTDLAADLAAVTDLPLRGEGIGELHRLLREYLADPEHETLEEMQAIRLSSTPLEQLSNRREQFFARMIKPFRRSARVGTLIWGIEDLENVDPLTLAFLDHFIREIRVHPSPIMLVLTVSPELLLARPGLGRYTESILQPSSTYARHLQILEPGILKASDRLDNKDLDDELHHLGDLPSDLDVNGSFNGYIPPSYPQSFMARSVALADGAENAAADLARWAALADGANLDAPMKLPQELSTSLDDEDSSASRETTSSAAPHNRPATERLALFSSSEQETLTPASSTAKAFDQVLGILAQLDERMIDRALWGFIHPRMLPFEISRSISFVLEHAERYGILALSETHIRFRDPAFVQSLRDTFEALPDAQEKHHQLASHLHEFSPHPDRPALRRIVEHAVLGGDFRRAVRLLLWAADTSAAQMDLDAAREYYLQFHALIDELATRSSVPAVALQSYPAVWLEIGKIQGALGEFGAAEDALRRALRECPPDDYRLRATANKLLGDLSISQERFQDARQYFKHARDLYQHTALARPYVASIGEIGRCAVRLGFPRQAEGLLLQAIDKADKLQDDELSGRLHRYMGEVMTRQARFLEAVNHLTKSMAIGESLHRHDEVLTALLELGRANYAAGCYEDSHQNYNRALSLASSKHLSLARSPHLGLASALAALNNLEQAEIHLVEAMSYYSTRNQPVHRARVQFHLGDLYLAKNRPGIAEEHFQHVFALGQNIGHRSLAIDALIRRGYALFDQDDVDGCFSALSHAVSFADQHHDLEARAVARAHIIYLQLRLHDFRAQGEAFSSLLQDIDERTLLPSHILADFFRVDLAIARHNLREAASLLAIARHNAASLGDYALFIPISRRETLINQQLQPPSDPHSGSGFALGALIPPEAGPRR